jgi:hypothetical protein
MNTNGKMVIQSVLTIEEPTFGKKYDVCVFFRERFSIVNESNQKIATGTFVFDKEIATQYLPKPDEDKKESGLPDIFHVLEMRNARYTFIPHHTGYPCFGTYMLSLPFEDCARTGALVQVYTQ